MSASWLSYNIDDFWVEKALISMSPIIIIGLVIIVYSILKTLSAKGNFEKVSWLISIIPAVCFEIIVFVFALDGLTDWFPYADFLPDIIISIGMVMLYSPIAVLLLALYHIFLNKSVSDKKSWVILIVMYLSAPLYFFLLSPLVRSLLDTYVWNGCGDLAC